MRFPSAAAHCARTSCHAYASVPDAASPSHSVRSWTRAAAAAPVCIHFRRHHGERTSVAGSPHTPLRPAHRPQAAAAAASKDQPASGAQGQRSRPHARGAACPARACASSAVLRAWCDPWRVHLPRPLTPVLRRLAQHGTWSCGGRARRCAKRPCHTGTRMVECRRGGARGDAGTRDASTTCYMSGTGTAGPTACGCSASAPAQAQAEAH